MPKTYYMTTVTVEAYHYSDEAGRPPVKGTKHSETITMDPDSLGELNSDEFFAEVERKAAYSVAPAFIRTIHKTHAEENY